jgi:hypothetical protein
MSLCLLAGRAVGALVLATLLPLPQHPALGRGPASVPLEQPLLARGGGFGGGGFGGGGGGGGFGRGDGGFGAGRSGFQDGYGAGGFNRGASKPSGGWAHAVDDRAPAPSLDGGWQRPNGGNGSWADRDSGWKGGNTGSGWRGGDGDGNRTATVNSNWNRNVNGNSVNVSPGWVRPGWGYARPWAVGWYGGFAEPAWGWWGPSAALWGVSTLATAAVINDAVSTAINDSVTTIVVPNSGYQLFFGTVLPSGSQGVTFMVVAGGVPYNLSADCVLGTIDGLNPSDLGQAELLNAACQVAFGVVT